jgi:hypothetical protein
MLFSSRSFTSAGKPVTNTVLSSSARSAGKARHSVQLRGRRNGRQAPLAPGPAGSPVPPAASPPRPLQRLPTAPRGPRRPAAHPSPELELVAAGVVARRSQTLAAVHKKGGDGAQMGQGLPHSCTP